VSASKLGEPLTSFETAPATVTDGEAPEVPRAVRDEDAVRYWTSRILFARRPAADIPRRYRNTGDHPEYADYATTNSDLRIALNLATGTPIEYVDRNGYETLGYLYMQRAAATRMGLSMAAYRRRLANGS
jgi:hypothetical protein